MVRPEINISLNEASETFNPGAEITGMIQVFSQQGNYSIRELTVTLKGYAKIESYKRRRLVTGHGRHRHVFHYDVKENQEEVYFTINTPLVIAPVTASSDWSVPLNRGQNDFAFHYTLPTEIPSSYENHNGSIIYEISVRMKERNTWFSDTVTQRKKIWVIARYNLSDEPTASQPFERHLETMLCCFCCKTGPIIMRVRVPHIGYLPGEYVQFSVEIINESSYKVSSKATLIELATFHTQVEPNKYSSKTIALANGPVVLRDTTQLWERRCLQVPTSTVPSKLGGYSTFIDVCYQMTVAITVGGFGIYSSLETTIPIIIGTHRTG